MPNYVSFLFKITIRQKVINFVGNGGTITEIAHIFEIGIASIYRWLSGPKMSETKVKRRQRKLDWKELEKDVKQNSQSKLSDKAKKFGVNQPAIFYALKRMKITRKKNFVIDKETEKKE